MAIFGSTFKTFTPSSDYTDAFVSTANAKDVRNMLLYWFEQEKKHIHKCSSTTRPDIFFESYDFIIDNIKKCTLSSNEFKLLHIHFKNDGIDFQNDLKEYQEHKEDEAAKFLERYFNTVQARNSSYKSPEARQVVASEFRFSLAPHMEKLTPKLQQQVEEYCQRLLKAE